MSASASPSPCVCGVIVTYKPDHVTLGRLLDALAEQLDAIVIVDNGSGDALANWIAARGQSREIFVALGDNLGIAAAQNRGIARARQLGASHVVLFDHDSEPAPDMVSRLLQCLLRLESEGRRPASVGPRYMDSRQDNPPPFIRVRGLSLARCMQAEEGDAVEVDYLIASGCLMPMAAIDVVGDMDEALFIDYVDIEWGLRARSKGFHNFGCFSAAMAHSLGDEPIRFCGTAYPARSPLRHYYMFRNAVLLYRMPHIPRDWKLADGLRAVLRFGFYALLARPRHQHAMMMLRGIADGLRGRGGKLEQKQ